MSNPEQPPLHNSPENPAESDADSAIRPDQEHTSLVDKLSILLRRFLPTAHKTLMQKDIEEAVKASEKEEKAWQAAYNNPQDRKLS